MRDRTCLTHANRPNHQGLAPNPPPPQQNRTPIEWRGCERASVGCKRTVGNIATVHPLCSADARPDPQLLGDDSPVMDWLSLGCVLTVFGEMGPLGPVKGSAGPGVAKPYFAFPIRSEEVQHDVDAEEARTEPHPLHDRAVLGRRRGRKAELVRQNDAAAMRGRDRAGLA